MNKIGKITLAALMIGLGVSGAAMAAPLPGSVPISADITVDTTLDANHVYHLTKPVFVREGASLIIPAGTVIASETQVSPKIDPGLVVCRDSKIFILGTREKPVIMTSVADVNTWAVDPSHPTGHNPKTGTWRPASQEWRNLTILGNGVISASEFNIGTPPVLSYIGPKIGATGVEGSPTVYNPAWHNPPAPDGSSQKQMEGLVLGDLGAGGDVDDLRYGGGNDDDDSGTIRYVSFRYTGTVVGAGNELNGLSLGAIGSATKVDHIDIINGIDDGIEIWGGKVSPKYVNIWNIGDDSFDCDEGWRGKAQFALLVQGYNVGNSQGGGAGDNMVEIDGAEQADAQPVTSVTLENFTVIGQPNSGGGDTATDWRDNANVQYRKCILMDIGEAFVAFKNTDGDGGLGYGARSTLGWIARWTAPWNTFQTTINAGAGAFAPTAAFYSGQTSGTLCEISDTVFYRPLYGALHTTDKATAEAGNTNGIAILGGSRTAPTNSGAPLNNVWATVSPLAAEIVRETMALHGGVMMGNVLSLNPLPAGDALNAQNPAETDSWFTPVTYRGAFAPGGDNWVRGWTAADAYGFVTGGTYPNTSVGATFSFMTANGQRYMVEASTDGSNWTEVAEVVGNGSAMYYSDFDDFDSAKIYRATAINPAVI